jgi:hypothetical protein
MNTLCTIATLAILSQPNGVVVGTVPDHKQVQIEDVSLLRDYVFISKPGPDGVSSRGWIPYMYLGQCQQLQPEGGS